MEPAWKEKDTIGRDMKHRRRLPSKARSKLELWIINKGGFVTVAELLGCSRSAVISWCDRKTTPKLEYAVALLKLSDGALSIEDILEGSSLW